MQEEGKLMSRISATVTANDDGGKVVLSIAPDPIQVPPGNHDILFALVSNTSIPTTFDTKDPIYYANGHSCPSSGRNCSQLNVISCTSNFLTLGDDNNAPNTIGYQLNFMTGNKKQHLDPIIINN
jgi:hypothetical protein